MPNCKHWRKNLEPHSDAPTFKFEKEEEEAVITIFQPEHNLSKDKALFYEIRLNEEELDTWVNELYKLYEQFQDFD